MTQDEIIEMARKAGMEVHSSKGQIRIGSAVFTGDDTTKQVEAFAKLVAAKERKEMAEHCVEIARMAVDKAVASAIEKEREACAKICEDFADVDTYPDGIIHDYHAHLIRLRGKA